jgi:acyl-coenzyme A thioesterase PaaI-like protein
MNVAMITARESQLAALRAGLEPVLEASQVRLDAMSREYHPHCVVCGTHHPFGLKADFRVTGEHTVEGRFGCGPSYQGYRNVVHGGIVSSLLDGAMVSCLLAKGVEAYTIELRVRYRAAVATGVPATIHGEWLRAEGPMHLLQATLEQDGKVCARARAKFFEGKPNQPSQPMPGGAGVRRFLNQARKRLV